MHEEQVAAPLQLREEWRERGEVVETLCRDAASGEAVAGLAVGECTEPAAGGADDLEDALVVGRDELGAQLQRRRARDERDVDPVTVESSEARVEIVRAEIDLERTVGELQRAAAQTWRLAPCFECLDQSGGPEVLMEVEGRHEPSMVVRSTGRGSRSGMPASSTARVQRRAMRSRSFSKTGR